MFRNVNLKRDHILKGGSIINIKKKRNKSPEIYKEIELKINDLNLENKKKIKPLTFKF